MPNAHAYGLPTLFGPHYLAAEAWIGILNEEKTLEFMLRLGQHASNGRVVHLVCGPVHLLDIHSWR